jgi:hypothetical protein
LAGGDERVKRAATSNKLDSAQGTGRPAPASCLLPAAWQLAAALAAPLAIL